jgi:diguanylate cyclase (GGDEF)-like protein
MMKKELIIYETDKEVLKFLRAFFKEKKDYAPLFVRKDHNTLKKILSRENPDALMISSPEGLRDLDFASVKCPIIALISRNLAKGLSSVVQSDVDCYLLSPFFKEELDHKLKVLIDRKNWIERLYEKNEDIYALMELASLASSTLNPKEVLFLIVKKISEIIRVTRCSMISINPMNNRYADVVSSFEDPKITNLRIDLRNYPEIRRALSLKKMVVVKDAPKDPLMKEVKNIITPLGIRSIVVIPVIFRDEVIGTLLLRTSRKSHTFTKREINLLIALANASANALYNAFLYERLGKEKVKLEKLAITDYLTGIYNIRYLYNRLEEEFSRAHRYALPLSCIMLDIDHFKRINDNYGHRIGDLVLREFAQLVKRHTRKSDLFARYGGEEFILLLPQTPLKGALVEARRLAEIIRRYRFKPLQEDHGFTVSFGISSSPHREIKNYDDLIQSADDALFRAKEKGRDQIITHSPA